MRIDMNYWVHAGRATARLRIFLNDQINSPAETADEDFKARLEKAKTHCIIAMQHLDEIVSVLLMHADFTNVESDDSEELSHL